MPANLENSTMVRGLKRSVYIPIPKKGSAKECSSYCTIALVSHASKVLLKILQGRFQQYVDQELPEEQAGFWRGRGTKAQIANMCWIMEKASEFHKNIYFSFIDYAKAFDCVDHSKLWQVAKRWWDQWLSIFSLVFFMLSFRPCRILSITLLVCEMSAIVQ